MRRGWSVALWALMLAVASRGVRAGEADLELDGLLEDKEKVLEGEMKKEAPGDHRVFNVVTDDDISALEVGDIYKSNGSFFKVTAISSKGASGGKFSAERTAGRFDPSRSWTRVSGLGPLTIVTRETLFSLYLSGGWVMHAISFVLLLAIVLTLNSIWVYRRKKQCPPRFVEDARRAIQSGDLGRFEDLALREKGFFPAICQAMAMDFKTSAVDDIKARCESRASQQITLLRMPLKALNLAAVLSPLMGLLGTVIGLVMCFESLQYEAASAAKSQLLAAGVRVALFTTVYGLLVAIPALAVYFFFSQKLNAIASYCEGVATDFVQQLAALKRLAGEPTATASADVPVLAVEKQP
ncbi:MAG: MotA/TolQ/ExbB proton channel family protein [Planctomycetes bacterium]|nr:MotA/TolQ/ExbB proton channel family protein [Planctomycetota bacterium]